jgi:pyridoxine 4-dehydrogenase
VTGIDTAYNYSDFAAHRLLAEAAGDLLKHFDITTKIGFFPGGHDLSAARLRQAAEKINTELGRPPDTLLLHNPEASAPWFTSACRTMVRLRDEGWCRAWGLSTWNPAELLGLAAPEPPEVLMVRSGLMAPAAVLDAADQLAQELKPGELRGMAPLGGHAGDPVWSQIDTTMFLTPGQDASRIQAAVAAAFAVPEVAAVAAGTGDPAHLAQLADAARLDVNPAAIAQYRALIRDRASVTATDEEA